MNRLLPLALLLAAPLGATVWITNVPPTVLISRVEPGWHLGEDITEIVTFRSGPWCDGDLVMLEESRDLRTWTPVNLLWWTGAWKTNAITNAVTGVVTNQVTMGYGPMMQMVIAPSDGAYVALEFYHRPSDTFRFIRAVAQSP